MLTQLVNKISRILTPAPAITPAKGMELVKTSKAALLDVRDAKEIATSGRAKGAKNVSVSAISAATMKSAGIKVDTPVLIYCATGMRSAMAGRKLAKLGYNEIYNMGSFSDWKAAGGTVAP